MYTHDTIDFKSEKSLGHISWLNISSLFSLFYNKEYYMIWPKVFSYHHTRNILPINKKSKSWVKLRNVCLKYKNVFKHEHSEPSRFVFNKEQKIMGCLINKVASTTIREHFLRMIGVGNIKTNKVWKFKHLGMDHVIVNWS